jgi:hypothetical protein
MSEITPVTFDLAQVNASSLAQNTNVPRTVIDIAEFQRNYAEAKPAGANDPSQANAAHPVGGSSSEGFRAVLSTLNALNGRVDQLGTTSKTATASGGDMSSGDMLMLTVRCHEFLFHCELTSNVANRTSDGVQQLFRQQS